MLETEPPQFNFDNSFARDLEGFFVPCEASKVPSPSMVIFNEPLAEELQLSASRLRTPLGAEIFSGNLLPNGAAPLAQAYAGHQFGNFSPQLGDGRALLLGEIIDTQGRRQDLQLKGSGRTPFSRSGDGKAGLGPVLREYLISEAMHALGVPTTRSLAAVTTGETIFRETGMPGAVLTRISASHLRVGTFEFFAARGKTDMVRRLADYAISRHYPETLDTENPYLDFFRAVSRAQIKLISHWMTVGFIHGVMNTDNTAISGQTIDYGPCAFIDEYNPETVFSSIDLQGRYAFGNQSSIVMWNLMRLADTLVPLIHVDKDRSIGILTDEIRNFRSEYDEIFFEQMRAKIGLNNEEDGDDDLVQDLLTAMQTDEADFTLTFRGLSDATLGDNSGVLQQFQNTATYEAWETKWLSRLEREPTPPSKRAAAMNKVNPIYIPRNHKVEEALSEAIEHGSLTLFEKILSLVSAPFEEIPGEEIYTKPAPETSLPYKTFCGT